MFKKLIKFEIYLKIKIFKKIIKNNKKILRKFKKLINFIKVCESFEQFK